MNKLNSGVPFWFITTVFEKFYQMKQVSENFLPMASFLKDVHSTSISNISGKNADYIPELSGADPNQFGIALTSSDGYVHEIGDSLNIFTIQSISKAFVYSLALELVGEQAVNEIIGVEPSGEAFNSIKFQDDNRPFNPMINAGAIACTALIYSLEGTNAFNRIQEIMGRFAGRNLHLDQKVFESENATGDRNRAIAWLLKNNKIMKTDVEKSLLTYFKQCSLQVSARDLSIMGATLACNGFNPVTKKRVISINNAIKTMSIMASAGMYDYSGEWLYRVGLPAKSGVGGGIIAALPSQFGLGSFSPPLDQQGNSVRGIEVCKIVSSYYNLHILETEGNIEDVISASYNLQNVRSSTERQEHDINILLKYGKNACVLELTGSLNFMAIDYIIRQVNKHTAKEFIILSMRKVSRFSSGAEKMLEAFIQNLSNINNKIIFSDIKFNSEIKSNILNNFRSIESISPLYFKETNEAIRWVEDKLLTKYASTKKPSERVSLKKQLLLKGLSPIELEFLKTQLISRKYEVDATIISKGDAADGIYFLQSGQVDISVKKNRSLTTINAGACFGEFSLVSPHTKRSANVIAVTDCFCEYLPIKTIETVRLSHSNIIEILLKNVALLLLERLQNSNDKISALLED